MSKQVEDEVDVERGTERVNGILGTPMKIELDGLRGNLSETKVKMERAPRSDKGSKRPQKPPAPAPGRLTAEQVEKLRELLAEREYALAANTDAERKMVDACERFDAYLTELQG